MIFFLEMDPPTVTAQMHRVMVRNGRPRFYDSKPLKQARAQFVEALTPHAPASPLAGAVGLTVTWYFLTKSHKEGEYRTTKPDTDNLEKLLKDCMTQCGFWNDDAQVCCEEVQKYWTRTEPGIFIKVEALPSCNGGGER